MYSKRSQDLTSDYEDMWADLYDYDTAEDFDYNDVLADDDEYLEEMDMDMEEKRSDHDFWAARGKRDPDMDFWATRLVPWPCRVTMTMTMTMDDHDLYFT